MIQWNRFFIFHILSTPMNGNIIKSKIIGKLTDYIILYFHTFFLTLK